MVTYKLFIPHTLGVHNISVSKAIVFIGKSSQRHGVMHELSSVVITYWNLHTSITVLFEYFTWWNSNCLSIIQIWCHWTQVCYILLSIKVCQLFIGAKMIPIHVLWLVFYLHAPEQCNRCEFHGNVNSHTITIPLYGN